MDDITTKAVITDEGGVSGWLAPFGGPFAGKDLDGEFFGPDTNFGLDYYATIPILWGHGRDGEIGAAKVGEITVKEIRDKGLWVEGQLDRQSSYYEAIRELAGKADMYWSSGSLSHLVAKDSRSGAIKQWPVAEATLTVTPANPLAAAAVKDDITITGASDGYSVTVTYAVKEGRRHSASDKARIQQIHQLLAELGAADPEPEPEPAGEVKDAPPADVLTIVGNDVVQPSPSDLKAVKAALMEFARAEGRRLIG